MLLCQGECVTNEHQVVHEDNRNLTVSSVQVVGH